MQQLIKSNKGYSLGALSEEGLDGNKDYETICQNDQKTSKVDQLKDVMFPLLERSHPHLENHLPPTVTKEMFQMWL